MTTGFVRCRFFGHLGGHAIERNETMRRLLVFVVLCGIGWVCNSSEPESHDLL